MKLNLLKNHWYSFYQNHQWHVERDIGVVPTRSRFNRMVKNGISQIFVPANRWYAERRWMAPPDHSIGYYRDLL